jgi:hypothetical protein
MPKTYRMADASGQFFDIPENLVKQASSDGLVLHGASPASPVPPALRGMQKNPYTDAAVNTATSLVGGTVAGAQHTLTGADNLIRKGLNKVGGNYPMLPTTPVAKDERPAFYGEQMAEFMLPSSWVGKASKAVEGAELVSKAPKLASFLTRVGGEALASGSVNALQGKDFTEGAEIGAASTAGGEALGYGLKKIGAPILNAALNISGAKLRRVNPAEFMFENGGFGMNARSAEAMRSSANTQAKQVYQRVSDITQNSPTLIDLNPMRSKGQEFMNQFGRQQNPNLMAQGEAIMDTANNVTLPSPVTGQPLTVPRNSQVPMTAAMDVRRGLGAARSWNGNNFFEPPVTTMRDAMYGQMNEAMRSVHPELRQLDNAYANLATVGDSISRKSSMWPSLVAAASTGSAGFAHGGMAEGVGLGLLGMGAEKMATSAPFGYGMGRLGAGMPTLFNAGKNAFLASQSDTQGTNPK